MQIFRYGTLCLQLLQPFSTPTLLTDAIDIKSETVLIGKIYTHFKKAPGTHKLGVLYVVDSVTRQWVEAARKPGQPSGPTASDGTFAAGVSHVTELLPSFMNDIINTAPEDQKVRFLEMTIRHKIRSSWVVFPALPLWLCPAYIKTILISSPVSYAQP